MDIIETDADDCIVLRIYRAPSGQWAGKLLGGGEEFGSIAGCESADEVEQAAYDSGIFPDRIELDSGNGLPLPAVAATLAKRT